MAARMRKRPDGRYCVSVSYEDGADVMRRHHVYGKTQAEANAEAKRLVIDSRRPRRYATPPGP